MKYYIELRVWKQILEFFHQVRGIHTKDETGLRLFVEAVWFMARSGCQWRLLPCCYGSWRAVHRRFKRWVDLGIWEKLMCYVQNNPDLEVTMLDTTIIRAHACSAGYDKNSQGQQALGRSRGGFTTKIHTLVDGLGNPMKFILTGGQRHDITQAHKLTKGLHNSIVIADKAYDSNALIQTLEDQKCIAVIPAKKNRKIHRKYDKHLYKERHLIECFFSKIKYYRRIFSRFDKTAAVFMGFLNFVGALIWLS